MASIRIITEKCIGCRKCIPACPFNAIEIRGEAKQKKAYILDNCTLCGACVSECKFGAIDLKSDKVAAADLGSYHGIWVYCEQFNGNLRQVGLELLGQARNLADKLGTEVTAVLIGNEVKKHTDTLIAHGADRVLLIEDPKLDRLHDLYYADVLSGLIKEYKPQIILLGATSFGRSLAPRVAARIKTGLTADCTMLDADMERGLLQTRPAFGGNLMATIICPNHRPQMATVRPKVFSPQAPDNQRHGQVIEKKAVFDKESGLELLDLIVGEKESVNIGDADIIVAIGKGIGTAKNIALAEELASLLGGAVAVSRPIVDAGWYGYSHQVGQTGKTVAPKLYIACGISGAIQHVAGLAAETIVAVNNDPDAPIFAHSHYAIQADCVDFLITLIEQIKQRGVHAI